MASWKDEYYLKAYQLALDGLTENQIASQFGTTPKTFAKWKEDRKALRIALREGQSRNANRRRVTGLQDYLYKRLSPEMKEVWKELQACWRHKNPILRMEALFDKNGEDTRKHLFLHAYTTSHWNPSEACRKVGINLRDFKKWMEDPQFAGLWDELHEHKKNFFESKLIEQVDRGDSKAIMFVNRTMNRDRGYAEKTEISHSGEITHEHKQTLDITAMPLVLQQKILEWMEKEERKQITREGDVA